MGKGRAPCCEKVGLKRGPWTPAEDMRLIAYIQKFGHGNWRALPKQAGLLRCGKSCRLRWINYLRPDIKRGNFTQEEEETIIRLHNSLGNKWSKIACQLPGRTDNEIKNVWNTHLKKKLSKKEATPTTSKEESKENSISTSSSDSALSTRLNQGDGIGDDRQINSIFDVDNSSNTNDLIEEKKKDDPLEVPIEIPVEPNIDIWDMLDDGICNTSLNKQFKSKESNYGTADEPKPSLSSSPTSSTSSTDNSCGSCLSKLADDEDLLVLFGEKDHDQSDEIMNLSDEYNMDLWDMLNGDGPGLMENSVGQERELQALNAAKEEGESKEDYDEKRWLMDLEYDLELKALSDEHQSSLTAVSNDQPQELLPTYDGTQELDVDPIVAYFQMHPSSPICLEMSWSN